MLENLSLLVGSCCLLLCGLLSCYADKVMTKYVVGSWNTICLLLLEHSVSKKNCRFLLSREGCPSQKLRVVVLAVESFIFSIDKNVSRGPLCDPFKKNVDASVGLLDGYD